VDMACYDARSFVVTLDGRVFAFGFGGPELGLGREFDGIRNASRPTLVYLTAPEDGEPSMLPPIICISSSSMRTVACGQNANDLFRWGIEKSNKECYWRPVRIENAPDAFVDLAAGQGAEGFTLLKSTSGIVYEWSFETGFASVTAANKPNESHNSNDAKKHQIACGGDSSFYIRDGTVFSLSRGLSFVKDANRIKRVPVRGRAIRYVFAGKRHAIFISAAEGGAFGCGASDLGQLGAISEKFCEEAVWIHDLDCITHAACGDSCSLLVHASYVLSDEELAPSLRKGDLSTSSRDVCVPDEGNYCVVI